MMTHLIHRISYTHLWNKVIFLGMEMLLTSQLSVPFIMTEESAKYRADIRCKPMAV